MKLKCRVCFGILQKMVEDSIQRLQEIGTSDRLTDHVRLSHPPWEGPRLRKGRAHSLLGAEPALETRKPGLLPPGLHPTLDPNLLCSSWLRASRRKVEQR